MLRRVKNIKRHFKAESIIELLSAFEYNQFGYPKISERYQQIEINLIGGPQSELDKYKYYTYRITCQQIVNFVLCSVILVKNLQFPRYTINSLENIERAIQNDVLAHGLQFGCLKTNCTSQEAFRKLVTFPIFPICNPEASNYNLPLIGLHSFGLILHSIYTISIVTMGITLITFLYFRPTNSDIFMFLLTPNTLQLIKCEQIRRYLIELHSSMANYYEKYECEVEPEKEQPVEGGEFNLSLEGFRYNRSIKSIESLRYELERLKLLEDRFVDLDQYTQDFIVDVVSIFRSLWWRKRIVELILKRYLFLAVLITLGIPLMSVVITKVANERRHELESVLGEFDLHNCSIRSLINPTLTGPKLLPEVNFSLLSYMELMLVLFPNLYTAATTLARYPVAISELNSMIAEQMDRIYMAIEITNIFSSMGLNTAQCTPNERSFNRYANMYNFRQLKQMHQRSITSHVYIEFTNLRSFKYRSNNCLASEGPWQVAMNLVSLYGANIYAYENLLVKIYIGNRSILDSVSSLASSFELVIFVLLCINYGTILISIYFNKKLHEISSVTVSFFAIGIFTNSFTTIFPSSVPAFSKHLIGSMWRLLTVTKSFNDIRIKHMRLIFLKQIEFMSEDEGLSIKAFGIPVSYKSVVKLALLSFSLIVVSFSR